MTNMKAAIIHNAGGPDVACGGLPGRQPTRSTGTSTLRVSLVNGETLTGSTESDVANENRNLAIVGRHGRWEVINFVNVTQVAPGVYDLVTLIHGNYGTVLNVANHEEGDIFVVLDGSERSIEHALVEVGATRYYEAVSIGQSFPINNVQRFNSGSLPKHNPIEPPWYVTRMPGGSRTCSRDRSAIRPIMYDASTPASAIPGQ